VLLTQATAVRVVMHERCTHDTATKIQSPAAQRALVIATFRAAHGWWLFCALVLAMKLLLLWLDPTLKLSMGDSGSYIWTALTGWIPGDRSHFYGYLVRRLAVWPHSFGPLLVVPGWRPCNPVLNPAALKQPILRLRARGDSNTRPTD
jgi:hypothetical protein